MKLVFWKAPKGYEDALAPAIISGAAAHGDEIIVKPTEEYRGPEFDGSILIGVVKREIIWDHHAKGVPCAYFDKGYIRSRTQWRGRNLPSYWRLCWNAVHPTAYLMAVSRPDDRWRRLGVSLKDRQPGERIVILGSSAKFHETEKLPHPTYWTQQMVNSIGRVTKRAITYRPKPSWADACAVVGADFDHGQKTAVAGALANAWCSVTHGSIACVDSIIAGVPCVVLGNGVAAPISSHVPEAVIAPYWAPRSEREQWAANLSYCHFSPAEIEDGTAWKILKEVARYAI